MMNNNQELIKNLNFYPQTKKYYYHLKNRGIMDAAKEAARADKDIEFVGEYGSPQPTRPTSPNWSEGTPRTKHIKWETPAGRY